MYDDKLFSIAVEMRTNQDFFFPELLQEEGWKYLVWCRHMASLALAYSPNKYFTREKAQRWVSRHNNVLLPSEVEPCYQKVLVLPFCNVKKLDLNSSEVLPWYEPYLLWKNTRVGNWLDDERVTVGEITGKFRLVTIAHMVALWEARQMCDLLIVGTDSPELDNFWIKDGFQPDFEDKVSMLRNITFPDGSKIDLIYQVRTPPGVDLSDYPKNTTAIWSQALDTFVLDERLKPLINMPEALLSLMRSFKDPWALQRLERLFYFVSEKDKWLRQKTLMAAYFGLEIKLLSYPQWMRYVSASKVVKKFRLQT